MAHLQHYRVSRSRFLTWLSAKERDEHVGASNSSTDCPLAKHIRSETGEDVLVGPDSFFFAGTARAPSARALPYWAHLFVEATDEMGREGTSVTRREALEIFRHAERRAAPIGAER